MIDDTILFAQLALMLGMVAPASLGAAPVLRVVDRHEEPVPLSASGYASIRNEPVSGVIHIIGNIED